MTHPTTNERLAELRAVTTIEDGWEDYWHSLYNEYRSGVVRIGDLRSLLARLDAAEDAAKNARKDAYAQCKRRAAAWIRINVDNPTYWVMRIPDILADTEKQ